MSVSLVFHSNPACGKWPYSIEVSMAPFFYIGRVVLRRETRFAVHYFCIEERCHEEFNFCSWHDIHDASDIMAKHLKEHD